MRKEAPIVRKKTKSPIAVIALESFTIHHPDAQSSPSTQFSAYRHFAYNVEMTTMANETSSCTMNRSLASNL